MRIVNQRCREVGCPAKLSGHNELYPARGVIQHGDNPEHVMFLTLDVQDWSGAVEAWLTRIHPAD